MPLPPELIVTVEKVSADPQDDQFLAVTSRSNGAEVCRNLFHFRPDLLVDFEPQWMLEKAVPRHAGEAVKRGPADATRSEDQEKKLAEYGQRLYGLLFGDGAKLAAFLEFNDAYRQQARLTLALHGNAATLWRLPWEYLHDEKDFLALTGRLLLSRMPHGLGRLDPAAAAPPLRILVVVSAPDDQRPLDTEEEIGAIQRALDEATRAGRVEVEYLDDATLPAIGEALRRFRPHVLHYTGHGYYDKAKAASFLALEDDDGCTRLAGIADLRPLLRDDPVEPASGAPLRLPDRADQRRGRVRGGRHRAAGRGRARGAGDAVLDPRPVGHHPGGRVLRRARRGRQPHRGGPARPHRPVAGSGGAGLRLGHPRALPARAGDAAGADLTPDLEGFGNLRGLSRAASCSTWAACPSRRTSWAASRSCAPCAAPWLTPTSRPPTCAGSAAWARAAWPPNSWSAPACRPTACW